MEKSNYLNFYIVEKFRTDMASKHDIDKNNFIYKLQYKENMQVKTTKNGKNSGINNLL